MLPLLHGGALTVNGRSIADNVREAKCFDQDVIRPLAMPLAREGGTVILFGNLCPDGAACDFDYLRGRTPVRHEDTAGPSHS